MDGVAGTIITWKTFHKRGQLGELVLGHKGCQSDVLWLGC